MELAPEERNVSRIRRSINRLSSGGAECPKVTVCAGFLNITSVSAIMG